MDFSVIAIDPPPQFPWVVVFSAMWPFAARHFARRGADIRHLMLLPILIALMITAIGLTRVAQVASLTGPSPHATAAGLAESIVPILVGCLSSLFVLVAVALGPGVAMYQQRIVISLFCALSILLGEIGLGAHLHSGVAQSSRAVSFGSALLVAAAVSSTFTAAQIGRRRALVQVSRATAQHWCLSLAVTAVALCAVAIITIRVLASFARGS